MSELHEWYEVHVPADAKLINDRYNDLPEVAPLYSDKYSSGEGTYMSSSVNTAMSYTTTWTSDTQNRESEALHVLDLSDKEPSETSISEPRTWAQRLRSQSRYNVSTPAAPSYDDGFMSDMVSSRAEVEELKMKLHQFEASTK